MRPGSVAPVPPASDYPPVDARLPGFTQDGARLLTAALRFSDYDKMLSAR